MKKGSLALVAFIISLLAVPGFAQAEAPLVIGSTFTLESEVMSEVRRMNVFHPPGSEGEALPVLYLIDGGISEDFLHIAGLVQVSVANGTMRPFLLVGIENTERRRDLSGPSQNPQDREIAPVIGGSAKFRKFIRTELVPEVEKRYRTTDERAIIGESLAGLFVVETLFLDPELFTTYVAVDPSLWWDNESLVEGAKERLRVSDLSERTLFIASSSQKEIASATQRLFGAITGTVSRLRCVYEPMPNEYHHTIFHPAALAAFRRVFAPTAEASQQ